MFKFRLNGRLGNQLFIYAFARKCLDKYDQKILIYDRKNEEDSMWHSHLSAYKLHAGIEFTSEKKVIMKMSIFRKALYLYNKWCIRNVTPRKRYNLQKRYLNYYLENGLLLLTDGYFELPDKLPDDMYVEGYFQSADYFNDIRPQLVDELLPKEEHTLDEKRMIEQIESTNSVCLTIRLGDYIGNRTHQVCTKEYYVNAMKKMVSLYPDCVFYAFSDEVDRLKELFDFDYPIIYDAGKSKDYMSLDVMRHCKHFIISNSSFSWWAQYLARNEDKTVIAPSHWYAIDVPNNIMQKEWLLVRC